MTEDRLADLIVIDVELFSMLRHVCSQQMLAKKGAANLVIVVAKTGGFNTDVSGQRLTGDCNQLEEPKRRLGQQADATLDNVAEPEGIVDEIAAAAHGQRVMDQLGDKEWVAGRFAGNRGGYLIPVFGGALSEQSGRQIARVLRSQIFHP